MGLLEKQKEIELSCISRCKSYITGWNEKTLVGVNSSRSLASPPVHTSQGDEVFLHYTMQTFRFQSGLHLTPVPTADNKFMNFSGQSISLPLANHANFSKKKLQVYWHSHEYLCYYKAFIESNTGFFGQYNLITPLIQGPANFSVQCKQLQARVLVKWEHIMLR